MVGGLESSSADMIDKVELATTPTRPRKDESSDTESETESNASDDKEDDVEDEVDGGSRRTRRDTSRKTAHHPWKMLSAKLLTNTRKIS